MKFDINVFEEIFDTYFFSLFFFFESTIVNVEWVKTIFKVAGVRNINILSNISEITEGTVFV